MKAYKVTLTVGGINNNPDFYQERIFAEDVFDVCLILSKILKGYTWVIKNIDIVCLEDSKARPFGLNSKLNSTN